MTSTPSPAASRPEPDGTSLAGGNATAGVVRVGDTVRKPWTPATAHVAAYLDAVRAAGVDAPRHLGRDGQGRQVIEFVPGVLAMEDPGRTRAQLAGIGALVRRIHDASARHRPAPDAVWDVLIPAPPDDPSEGLVCHGDLTPWNLVLGERTVFIDWDGAGPSTRAWDLAYSAQAFTLNDPAADPATAARDLVTFLEGYGADEELRTVLPDLLVRRSRAMLDLLAEAHRRGTEPWGSMYLTGHGEHWRGVSEYLERNRELIAAALTGR